MSDERQTISTSRLTAADVARRTFRTVRRGFDPQEVRGFLEMAGRELAALEQREEELRRDLAAAEERARHPMIDEATLTSALGQRSAAVLRSAHEEAEVIGQRAEETAAALLHDAQQRASEVRVKAESSTAERIAEAEIAANALNLQAREEAAAVIETARAEGEVLLERARREGKTMLEQAQEARRRVLADMVQRRRAMSAQIEQFRAARDKLATAVMGVRHSFDRIVDDLGRADEAARAAASDVAHRRAPDVPEHLLVEEAERLVDEVGAATIAATPDGEPPVVEQPTGVLPVEEPTGESFVVEEPPGESLVVDEPTDVLSVEQPTGVLSVEEPTGVPSVEEPTGAPEASRPEVSGAEASGADDPRGGATGPSKTTDSLEGLFARLRASREQRGDAENAGHEVGGPPTAEPGVPGPATVEPVAGELAEGARGEHAPEPPVVTAPATAPSRATSDLQGAAVEPAVEGAPGDADDGDRAVETAVSSTSEEPGTRLQAALALRSELLDPVVVKLSRRLKRVLQDDQNAVLDRLRHGAGMSMDEVLVSEQDQRAAFSQAASPHVREAVAAGIGFARSGGGKFRRGRSPAPEQRLVDALAEELAANVVTILRRRLTDEDGSDAVERIGAAYREWRGERIERLVGDRALEAFSAGTLAGAGGSDVVRWVLSRPDAGCPDCEDNALAGALSQGEEFPTGHRYPPAHAGCRCLVVATPT